MLPQIPWNNFFVKIYSQNDHFDDNDDDDCFQLGGMGFKINRSKKEAEFISTCNWESQMWNKQLMMIIMKQRTNIMIVMNIYNFYVNDNVL